MPADPTDADREAAEDLLPWAPQDADGLAYRQACIAQALADEREHAVAPFLALAAGWADQPPATVGGRVFRHCAHEIRTAAQEPTP